MITFILYYPQKYAKNTWKDFYDKKNKVFKAEHPNKIREVLNTS